eukprot:TRINITY_DN2929_c0_g1_i3.p1 TRINITY_DN2929_c0_g1~~TRINITY_DN2929_c0_g1_i3.p1  ORF type:complete len:204 (+),score=44.56 TRINITY_DN2929_c0_g1_i3:67-678(+)
MLILIAVNYMSTKHVVYDLIGTANGTLGGLVGITASCAVVEPWAAVVIGILSGFVYIGASNFVLRVLKIDDPLDAVAVHGFCGIWGLIAAAAFADKQLVNETYGTDGGTVQGFFMGGDGGLLAAAIVGIIVIFGWVSIFMAPFFTIMKFLGLLRVTEKEELSGLDESHHGGSAYPGEVAKSESAQMADFQARLVALEKQTQNS